MSTKLLFIGSYLSKHKGSFSASESISIRLNRELFIETSLCSSIQNKYLRFIDLILNVIFRNYNTLICDVYSGNSFTVISLLSKIAKFRQKKVILILHGGALCEYHSKYTNRVHSVFEKANAITSPSSMLVNYFEQFNFKIVYIPNFIDLEIFKPLQFSPKKNSILWVRAFHDIYNPFILIRSLAILCKKYSDVKVTMVGPDLGLLSECIQLANDLNLSNHIDFIGPVNNDSLNKYYSTHSVYVNTTKYESFGLSVMEAGFCNTPIISTSVGELNLQWKDNFNILFFDLASVYDLANKISILFDNPHFAKQLSDNAFLNASKFTWSNIKDKWLNLINNV